MNNKTKIIKALIKEYGILKGLKEILPYCIPSIKKYNNSLFFMIPDFKNMLQYDILNCKSINKYSFNKERNRNKLKNIEYLIPHIN